MILDTCMCVPQVLVNPPLYTPIYTYKWVFKDGVQPVTQINKSH